jgi:hypothetical protein
VGGEQRPLGQPLRRRLGDAEVDHLDHRRSAVPRHQDVRRLDVAVDDPLVVGVLDGLADVEEQSQPGLGRQAVLVAELDDRPPLDQFHDEVGPPGVGGPGVEDPGDVGVVHQAKRLPLRLEPRQHLAAVQARLDDLQRDPAADRLLLLSQVDDAHAAFTDLPQEPVRADDGAGGLGGGVVDRREQAGPGLLVKRAQLRVRAQQLLDLRAEQGIAGTGLLEKGRPQLQRVLLDRRQKDRFRLVERRAHDARSPSTNQCGFCRPFFSRPAGKK